MSRRQLARDRIGDRQERQRARDRLRGRIKEQIEQLRQRVRDRITDRVRDRVERAGRRSRTPPRCSSAPWRVNSPSPSSSPPPRPFSLWPLSMREAGQPAAGQPAAGSGMGMAAVVEWIADQPALWDMDAVMKDRLARTCVRSDFDPRRHVSSVRRCSTLDGWIFRFCNMKMRAERPNDVPGACGVLLVHGTTPNGVVGILKLQRVLGSSTLNEEGIWGVASATIQDEADEDELFERAAGHGGRNQANVLFGISAWTPVVKLQYGGHDDETLVIQAGNTCHKPAGKRWCVPTRYGNLTHMCWMVGAMPGSEVLLQ